MFDKVMMLHRLGVNLQNNSQTSLNGLYTSVESTKNLPINHQSQTQKTTAVDSLAPSKYVLK